MIQTPTVFVVDDEPSVRTAVERLVDSVGLRCETFPSADDYLKTAPEDAPGCLVLDVRLPGWSGLEFQQMLKKAGHQRPIIFLTAYADVPVAVQAMKAGALEFLTKPFDAQELIDAIQRALEEDRRGRARRLRTLGVVQRYRTLTRRQREVMGCVVAGVSNKDAAKRLGISARTVKAHRADVMRKMQAHSVADLVRMAQALGLPPPEG